MTRVSEAISHGAVNRRAIVRETGLDADLVDAAIERLERMGRLSRAPLGAVCSGGGCSGCPDAGSGGGCAPGGGTTGPVALVLRRRGGGPAPGY
ncbi:FeoC-like transcriptional regulator [Corynebacterium sp. CCM 9185]|uniref:Transcriptional regulator HTH-type FeoC domain-containing protein n=1 Tax=Corynebacterium marambiense TaxID=2765364 RepID=A0ABS0VTD1_9CORY|nr:FeoC-like transcriptional regulator [Corynebacterium marambiense]MBI9000017.1 hypothetical protein [Corynebacterium marambiense]MCK7663369.1 FeoC-like transcriptional regulator [Corynebacterium marambiense]MCX7542197.1 FeoC-like transcriptional regulator [Corynebacterium marambiense]